MLIHLWLMVSKYFSTTLFFFVHARYLETKKYCFHFAGCFCRCVYVCGIISTFDRKIQCNLSPFFESVWFSSFCHFDTSFLFLICIFNYKYICDTIMFATMIHCLTVNTVWRDVSLKIIFQSKYSHLDAMQLADFLT